MAIRPDDVVALLMFARVVEHRSFTEAARALGVAKSVVSARVTRLEAKMGVRLLHRTTRLVTLTADGAALYQRCLRLIADAEDAEQCAAGAAAGPRGLLRVNAPVTFGLLYLARPIAEFLGRHPDVKIDLSLSDRFVDVAGEGLDVVIRIATRLEDSNLHARKLASDRRVVCGARTTSPGRGRRRRPPTSPSTTASVIRSPAAATSGAWAPARCQRRVICSPTTGSSSSRPPSPASAWSSCRRSWSPRSSRRAAWSRC